MNDLIGHLYPDGTLILADDIEENMGDDFYRITGNTTIKELEDISIFTSIQAVLEYQGYKYVCE